VVRPKARRPRGWHGAVIGAGWSVGWSNSVLFVRVDAQQQVLRFAQNDNNK
jgi:hypothetical protein